MSKPRTRPPASTLTREAYEAAAADAYRRLPILEAALLRYGKHEKGCSVFMPTDSSCTCGWQGLRATLTESSAEEPLEEAVG